MASSSYSQLPLILAGRRGTLVIAGCCARALPGVAHVAGEAGQGNSDVVQMNMADRTRLKIPR